MKKPLFLLLPLAAFSFNASAENAATTWTAGGLFASTAVLGAAVAGPLGMIAGAMGGVWLGEKVREADRLPDLEIALREASRETQRGAERIELLEADLAGMSEALASRLEFQVLFPTGSDEMQADDAERMRMLAGYLLRNPGLKVRLDGYADPRGTDEYNNILAQYRAANVAAALNQLGIPRSRMEIYHHGARSSRARPGDLDAFALERRVDIQVFQDSSSQLAME